MKSAGDTPGRFSEQRIVLESGGMATTAEGYRAHERGEHMAATKEALIKADLKGQLQSLKKTGMYFDDLIEDYIYLWKLKKKLQKDIKQMGIRYTTVNGNGKEVEKTNDSVASLLKVTAQMLKLLSDVGLTEPTIGGEDDVNDYC